MRTNFFSNFGAEKLSFNEKCADFVEHLVDLLIRAL